MTHADLRAVRLISERYWELQGLRTVLVGGLFAACAGLALLTGAADSLDHAAAFGVWMLAAFVLLLPGMWMLDRYYARTFGRMRPPHHARRFGTVVFIASIVGQALGLGMVLFFLAFAALELWIALRDWPFRRHMLMGALTALAASGLLWGSGAPDGIEPTLWAFLLFGTGMVPVGILDHWLLSSVLKPAGRAGAARAADDRPAG